MFRIFEHLKANFFRWLLSSKTVSVESLMTNLESCQINNNGELKFIGQQNIDKIYVQTPSGYVKIKQILKTVSYRCYCLKLVNKLELICADDHLLIDVNQVQVRAIESLGKQIITEKGASEVIEIIDLDKESSMYDLELADENHVFYTNGILSHNTETTAAYAYWFACFHDDKNVLVASNRQRGATDIMNRIKFMYENTPNFLRPGVPFYNRGSVEFDNGSKIWSEATTEETGRGRAIALFVADELAHVNKRIQEGMWGSIFPTLSTGGSCVVMSTPNGDNDLYAELWRGAVAGNNGFVPVFIPIEQIPERDEAWQEMMKQKLGELRFRQEYLAEFLSDDPLLIKSITLQGLKETVPLYTDKGFVFWKEIDPFKTYLVGVDVAEGVKQDFSTIEVIELETLEQVAEFRNNGINESQLYDAIKFIVIRILSCRDKKTNRPPTLYWSFENNSAGAAISTLYFNDEKFPEEAQLISGKGDRAGFRTLNKPKLEACRHFKYLVEKTKGNLTIRSKLLIFEMKNYISTGASYAAKHGATDDLISAMLIIMRILKLLSEYEPEVFDKLYKSDSDFYDETTNNFEDPLPFFFS